MAIKVGINGFGRIGRLVFRAGLDNPNIEFVGINDPFMTPDYCAYMLKYDTVHGRYTGDVKFTEDSIIVEGKEVKFYAEKDPANIPWAACGAEYVVDSTGVFTTSRSLPGAHQRRCEKGCYLRSGQGQRDSYLCYGCKP